MINRILALFEGTGGVLAKPDELHLAAAALLVEAACMDGDFDAAERGKIARLLVERFALSADEAETLIDEAVVAVNETGQLYGFTRVVKDRYEISERIQMIEMLWEVAFADGQVDHFESNLIRRIGGLLFVTDRDRGLAKQRVMARRGTPI
ncbi:MAG: hypothetical protein K0Q70_1537 [Rhodospirillales bacterium]|jgi:uncharacterized tellurite resistance protein B-like protein|nr:hypothetical protein [Rhodospirillales bacterium]